MKAKIRAKIEAAKAKPVKVNGKRNRCQCADYVHCKTCRERRRGISAAAAAGEAQGPTEGIEQVSREGIEEWLTPEKLDLINQSRIRNGMDGWNREAVLEFLAGFNDSEWKILEARLKLEE